MYSIGFGPVKNYLMEQLWCSRLWCPKSYPSIEASVYFWVLLTIGSGEGGSHKKTLLETRLGSLLLSRPVHDGRSSVARRVDPAHLATAKFCASKSFDVEISAYTPRAASQSVEHARGASVFKNSPITGCARKSIDDRIQKRSERFQTEFCRSYWTDEPSDQGD